MTTNILEYLENTAARLGDKLAFSTGEVGMTFCEVQRGAAAIGSYIAKKKNIPRACGHIYGQAPCNRHGIFRRNIFG